MTAARAGQNKRAALEHTKNCKMFPGICPWQTGSILGSYSFPVSQTGSTRYSAVSQSLNHLCPGDLSQCLGSHLLSGVVTCVGRIDRQARQAVLWEKKRGQLEEAESSRPWLAFWLDLVRCYQKGLLQPISAGFLSLDTFLVNLSTTLWAGTFIYLSCLLVGWFCLGFFHLQNFYI